MSKSTWSHIEGTSTPGSKDSDFDDAEKGLYDNSEISLGTPNSEITLSTPPAVYVEAGKKTLYIETAVTANSQSPCSLSMPYIVVNMSTVDSYHTTAR